jgi:hypothetical protein
VVSHRTELASKEVGDASTEEPHHGHPRAGSGRGATRDGRFPRGLGAEDAREERPAASPSRGRPPARFEEQAPPDPIGAAPSNTGAHPAGGTTAARPRLTRRRPRCAIRRVLGGARRVGCDDHERDVNVDHQTFDRTTATSSTSTGRRCRRPRSVRLPVALAAPVHEKLAAVYRRPIYRAVAASTHR